jgi:DNA-binding PadR family transcriptional regulator
VATGVRELAPGEWAVLGLLCEQPAHGWALARQLTSESEIGAIWSLRRPLVYRSLEILEQRGLIAPAGRERSVRGPSRTIFEPTVAGRETYRRWLTEPVEHVRDVRSQLLLKLVLADRAGLELLPLLEAQRRASAAAVQSLEHRLVESSGSETIFVRFRLESTRAVLRFVEGLAEERAGAVADGET